MIHNDSVCNLYYFDIENNKFFLEGMKCKMFQSTLTNLLIYKLSFFRNDKYLRISFKNWRNVKCSNLLLPTHLPTNLENLYSSDYIG